MLDWVIRGGTVIDGSGGAPFRADIGIRSGKIAAVGSCGEAAQTLDVTGLSNEHVELVRKLIDALRA